MEPALDALAYRSATADDATQLAAVLVEGFETYRAFAPPDWQPPFPATLIVRFESERQKFTSARQLLVPPFSRQRL